MLQDVLAGPVGRAATGGVSSGYLTVSPTNIRGIGGHPQARATLGAAHIRPESLRINEKSGLAESFFDAHRETTLLKEKILCEASVSEESRRLILDRGIGGIRNLKKVKCLHLHLANYLGGIDNPVGREVWNLLEKKQCSSTKIICRELLRENE